MSDDACPGCTVPSAACGLADAAVAVRGRFACTIPVVAATILQALDDDQLLGAAFPGDRASWSAWRTCLKAAFGIPLDDAEIEVFRAHTGRTTPPSSRVRELWAIVGRRGGKSRMAALMAVYLATCTDPRPHLAAGERATVALLGADRQQCRVLLRYIRGFFEKSSVLWQLVTSETASAIELANRVTIEVHTSSFRSVRGYAFLAVLCDELAFWKSDEMSANPDVEVLGAIRPGLMTLPGSMLVCISSPYAKKGALWRAFREHYGRDDARALVWRATSEEMNPAVDREMIATAYALDPASAAAEYGAQFRQDIETFISRELLDQVVVPDRRVLPPCGGIDYAAFADPSGGQGDSFTLAIAHSEIRGESATVVVDVLAERRPPFNPSDVVAEYAALLREYRIQAVEADKYAAQWTVEAFAKVGITCTQTAEPKAVLYANFLPLVASGRVELLDHPRALAQLASLERRTGRGRDVIDHPAGGFDDCANVLAGVSVLTAGRGGVVGILLVEQRGGLRNEWGRRPRRMSRDELEAVSTGWGSW